MSAVKKIKPLFISKPLLPEIDDLKVYIENIWNSGWVTNNGPYHIDLEKKLQELLEVPTAMLFNNGTSGIVASLMHFELPIEGEVITTPMTFAATAHAISMLGLKPVFVDIKEDNLTIDPEAVIKAITPRTVAILGVHAYGFICDDDALRKIADKFKLKLIYDAAHAFNAKINNQSVASLGDASIFSFHATKLFNTLEGGLVTSSNIKDREGLYLRRNFGILNEEEVTCVGFNGKMNELQAAIGLLNLDLIHEERRKRKILRNRYHEILCGVEGVIIPHNPTYIQNSEQYMVIKIIANKFGRTRDEVKTELENKNIYCRKYFYPICTDFLPYKNFDIFSNHKTPYLNIAKEQVLCLPFHSGVQQEHIKIIKEAFFNR